MGTNYESGWKSAHVSCPFWKGAGRKLIQCEGITNSEKIQRTFRAEGKCSEAFDFYCCGRYKACPIFSMLMQKYDK